MKLEKGNTSYGFLLEQTMTLKDIRSEGFLFRHEKSGARLFYVKNTDNNKVFSITFKTPPNNHCGTPHILEHSVLCGSQKYEAKDPFNELAKGSLHTYLNALTYGDKTMYPVASCNEKDLINMMDVYLDAVFAPKIYEKEQIFMQEGWHYELNNLQEPLVIRGVVYNEMKGALSDPESILSDAISESLFPTSIYGLESGGKPEAIPELTYADFLKFHQKYYHPSNSYIYLYGDMDLESKLKYLDEAYLSKYTVSTELPVIALEEQFLAPKTVFETFPVAQGEGEKGNTYLTYNVRVSYCTDPTLNFAFDILRYLLLESNGSVLRKALMDSGIGAEVEGWFDSSTYETTFSIIVKKAETEKVEDFVKIIEDTLGQIVKEGIDKKLIASTLNRWEFYLKEESFGQRPIGLTYGMKLMKSWLHGENPSQPLCHWEHFETIKQALTSPYFEDMITTYLLNNNNKTILILSPEEGKQTSQEAIFVEKMAKIKASMTQEELEEIVEKTNALAKYQVEEESEEVLSQIPVLALNEVEKEPEILPTRMEEKDGVPLLFTPLETNGIVYSQLLFDTVGISNTDLPYVGLLAEVLGDLDTRMHTYEQLPLAINEVTGGMGFSCDTYSQNSKSCNSFLVGNGKTMEKNLVAFFALWEDICFTTKFSEEKNLKKLIQSAKIKVESRLLNQSHMMAVVKSMSAVSFGSWKKDQMLGISFYQFLCGLEKELDKNCGAIGEKLQGVLNLLLEKQRLTIAVASTEEGYKGFQKAMQGFLNRLPNGKKAVDKEFFPKANQVAFSGVSKVQYHAKSANYKDFGYSYSGSMQVLRTVLNLEYLWNRVRVQGGAYGCGCQFLKNGSVYFYSYRDPNTESTFRAYDESADFLEKFKGSEKDRVKYILGTINVLDQPKSNGEKADLAVARHFLKVTPEALQKERVEVLHTTWEELKKFIPLLEIAMAQNNICSIGNEDILNEKKNLYNSVYPLL